MSGSIVVGSADFPESALLAEIYGQALAAAGTDVSYQLNIGSREAYITAIKDGDIDLVPEYTGNLLAFLTAPEQPSAVTVDEQVAALADALPDGLEVLTPSSAEDKDTIVCTQDVVDAHHLTDLSSLFAVADQITLGAPPEFETRTPFGIKGFKDIYDATFKEFVPLAPADIKDALSSGAIDCGNIFSTDPAITTDGFRGTRGRSEHRCQPGGRAADPVRGRHARGHRHTRRRECGARHRDARQPRVGGHRGPAWPGRGRRGVPGDDVGRRHLVAPAGSASSEVGSTQALSSTVPATTG